MTEPNKFYGNVKLNVEAGIIQSVHIGAGLDSTYERLFEASSNEIDSSTDAVGTGVAVIVFGCMWLEALCNKYLPEILEASGIEQRAADALGTGLDRAPAMRKVRAIVAFGNDAARGDDWLAALEEVFQVRNSLVHFREKETQLTGEITFDEFKERMLKMDLLPEAVIVQKLKRPHINRFAATIDDAGKRLYGVYRQFFPSVERKAEP